MTVSTYLPFAGKNSIVEASFGIQFALPVDSSLNKNLEAVRVALSPDFPSFDKMQAFQLAVSAQQTNPIPSPMPSLAGFTASKPRANGQPLRVIRAIGNLVTVHLLEYDRWADKKLEAIRALTTCTNALEAPSSQNPVTAILLRFVDRFTFDGDPMRALASELFRAQSKFITPKIMEAGNVWHSTAGWFETIDDDRKLLQQLRLQSMNEGGVSSIIVDHNCIYNLNNPLSSLQEDTHFPLNDVLDAQHQTNSAMLKNLLNDEMLKKIGLQ